MFRTAVVAAMLLTGCGILEPDVSEIHIENHGQVTVTQMSVGYCGRWDWEPVVIEPGAVEVLSRPPAPCYEVAVTGEDLLAYATFELRKNHIQKVRVW